MTAEPRKIGVHTPEVMALARVLYEEMERLDPGSGGGTSWDDLPDLDVNFYAFCVSHLINHPSLILRAMTHYDIVLRHPNPTKQAD